MFRQNYFDGIQLPESVKRLQKISQPLYDQLDIAGPGTFTYFKGSQGRSRLFTNFDGQNQLDNPRSFLCLGIRFIPAADVPAADVQVLSKRAYFQLSFIDKPFFEAPLSILLAKEDALQVQGMFHEATFKLDHPILIPSQQIFKPTLTVEGPAALSAPASLTMVFDGVMLRSSN